MKFWLQSIYRAFWMATVAAFSLELPLQSGDFEHGFDGWTATGTAFDAQPVLWSDVLTDRIAPVTVGGDYWRRLSYPLGQRGNFLISSAYAHGDGATGTLTSPPIVLGVSDTYLTFLVGGTKDPAHQRVELQVRESPSDPYVVVAAATGEGYEQLRRTAIAVPVQMRGREARVHIVDDSAAGHINVDDVAFSSAIPDDRPIPVWGLGDYHTHPMSHMAFGGLKGVRAIWGVPGGSYDDYLRTPALVDRDLPRCERGHGGGPYANPFLNAAQELAYKAKPKFLFGSHGKSGAPDFDDFPAFNAGAHEQMHITQIRRSYEGGLRLMVGLATDNMGAEYLMSHVDGSGVRLVGERASLEAQVAGMIDLARLNASWLQVAYSAAEARAIILRNKLALVLGAEVDQLGRYHCDTLQEEVEYLWNLGVRAVTPIHAADNALGGAAVFLGPYNWLNDLLHRDQMHLSKKELDRYPARFFEIEEADCEPQNTTSDGECVQRRLEWDKQNRLYIGRCFESFYRLSPCLHPTKVDGYRTMRGHKNRKGLTAFGKDYVAALMARGMILDTAHMSDHSVADTYEAIGRRLERAHPQCRGFSFDSDVSNDCNRLAYPAIVSHAHFRAQAFYGGEDFLPSEYDIGNRNIEMVRRVGGVLGPFVAEDRISLPWDSTSSSAPPVDNDCAMSSKSFAYSFHFARQRLGTLGVGMATDFTFIPGAGPRFGDDACWAYNLAKDPGRERRDHSSRYDVDAQRDGVLYEGLAPAPGVSVREHTPLKYYALRDRKYDFNVDGLAHYGMVPDLLQDLKNIGFPRADFESLFSSAHAYLLMWERTEQASDHSRARTRR